MRREAEQLAERLHARPWDLVLRLETCLRHCRGTEHEAPVARLLDDARRACGKLARSALEQAQIRTAPLVARGHFAGALAILDALPEHLRRGNHAKAWQTARGKLLDEAETAFREAMKPAREAAAAGGYDAAIRAVQPILEGGLPDQVARARRAAEAWQRDHARTEREARARAVRAAQVAAAEVVSNLRERRVAAAVQTAARAAAAAPDGPLRERLRILREDAEQLGDVWKEANRRLTALRPGDKVRVGSIMLRFVRFEKGIVHAGVSGMQRSVSLAKMRETDLMALLDPYFDAGAKDAERQYRKALFYIFDREADEKKARAALGVVESLGAKSLAVRGRRHVEMLRTLADEVQATAALDAARAAIAARDWARARGLLREAARTRSAAFQTRYSEWLDLTLRAAGRGQGIELLFGGDGKVEPDGSVALTCDLSRPGHRRDWHGGKPSDSGVMVESELRWCGGIWLSSAELTCRFCGPTRPVSFALHAQPYGDQPYATATLGRGPRQISVQTKGHEDSGELRLGAGGVATFEVALSTKRIVLKDAGRVIASVPAPPTGPLGRTIILATHGTPLEVRSIVLTGMLDVAWAVRRLADLADAEAGKHLATIAVPANRPGVPSGVDLQSGRTYHLRATGLWDSPRDPSTGPNGMQDRPGEFPRHALLARSGDDLLWIGGDGILGPHRAGPLHLGMRHVVPPRECTGSIRVTIRELDRHAPAAFRPGLIASYFAGPSRAVACRRYIDGKIERRGRELRRAVRRGKPFVAHWEGWIRLPDSGSYSFGVNCDGDFRVEIDGLPALELTGQAGWRDRLRRRPDPIRFGSGLHRVEAIYVHEGGREPVVQLWWQRPPRVQEVIPASAFFHAPERAREVGID
jgi:hypothetical protein